MGRLLGLTVWKGWPRVGAWTGTLKNPTKCLCRWELDLRSNFLLQSACTSMCRHIYDWNIVDCDVEQPIHLTAACQQGTLLRLRLIRSGLRASKFSVFKLLEIVIVWVYYTIPFGFSMFRHFRDIIFNFWVELSWIGCLTSQLTIFQSCMWRHIDVQADWRRSWTYGRAPNAIDIS